jgi:TPR repeat protein
MLKRIVMLLFGVAWATLASGCEHADKAAANAHPPPSAATPEEEAVEDEPEPGDDELTASEEADALFAKGVAAERAGKLDAAARWFEEACGAGLGTACGRLGDMYGEGRGVPADDDRAHSLFEQGCALGSSRACDAVGH